jgi:GntR family transcriptional regulator/MocR family aminotransferase
MKKPHPLIFSFDHSRQMPLFRQLYEAIKEQIMSGVLAQGDALPATRTLALDTGVSRSSVVNAYEQLLTEGYISGIRGAGYRVQPIGELELNRHSIQTTKSNDSKTDEQPENMMFDAHSLDRSLFPTHQWAKTISRLCRREPESMMFGEAVRANQLLREAIVAHVYEWRGIKCESWQIIITAGSMEALEMCIDTLSQPGETINMEDPCYPPARRCVESKNRLTHPLSIDENGARISDLHNASRLAIITPSHQFPLGITMSAGRRMEFIYWAQKNNGWIIEDDYDSEFRYGGRPIPALAAFDKIGRTFYIGSFSKLFSSLLRISYLIVPPQLVKSFDIVKHRAKASMIPQRVLAEFIANGEFYKYLRRARKIYAARRQHFLTLLQRELSPFGFFHDHKAGTLLVFHLTTGISDTLVVEKARKKQLSIRAISTFSFDKTKFNGLVMGFIAWNESEISAAVEELKIILGNIKN